MFSILILTRNEEDNIRGCLESVAWCDDVVVLDSLSDDDTVCVARDAGARIFEREFDDFAGQRNYAIDNVEFLNDWVFHLDADERFTPELREECRHVIQQDEFSGFQVPSRMILWGRWLKHAACYPVYQMRLMKLGEVRFTQHGHGQREVKAKRGIGKLSSPYDHLSFSKGLSEWFERHNRYSTQEAEQAAQELAEGGIDWKGLLSRDSVRRRRALKGVSLRLPFRPSLKFLYLYVFRLGFLDGLPGLTYCTLQALYERMICLKMREWHYG